MSNTVAEKKQLPAFVILAIISLVAALALALTNAITEGPIRELEMKAQREAFGVVLQADEYTEVTIPDGHEVTTLVEAKTNGETVGYCVVASTNGYAGPVAVTLGVDTEGKITGAKIGDTNFVETNGFGSRWLAADQADKFVGIDIVEGGAIEALSGATVTSTAVLSASNKALAAVNAVMGNATSGDALVFGVAEKKPVEQMELTGDIYEGTAKGFQSDVTVKVTMDEAGVITGLVIDSSNETAGFGTRCMEEAAFAEQFVGKSAPFAVGENIDALSGATVTSKAVAEAVNAAVTAPVSNGEEAAAAPTEEPFVPMTLTGDIKEGTAKGFQSEVKVQLTTDENGAITGLVVDSAAETTGFGTRCGEDEAFINQFIGKAAPVTADVLTGATVTSNAVIEAVNAALAPAAPVEEATAEPSAEPVVEEPVAAPAGTTYEGTAKGFQSDVKVTVTVDEAGAITGLVVDSAAETTGFGTRCGEDEAFINQFIGKTAPVTADVLTGATVTSNAVIEAVNAALAPAAPVEEATAEPSAEPVVEEPVAAPAGTTYEGTAKGFQSDVKVTVTVDEAGVITGLVIDSAAETTGFGTRCGEDEAFINQFIGKTAPVTADVLTGATVTSNAVIEAVNAALAPAAPVEEATAEPSAEPVVEEPVAAPAGTTYEGTAKGFQSDVKVTVTVDEAGVITGLVIDSAAETTGFGTRCGEDEAFINQFIGKTAPVTADVLTGATVTSNAVIEAINAALPAVEAAPVAGGAEESAVEATAEPAAEPTVEPTAEPAAEEPAVLAEEQEAADLTKTVPAFANEDVVITVTLNEDGTIATLTVDASTQSPGLGKKCAEDAFVEQFVGQSGPFVLNENIDAVSYATITSQAVVDAVNALLAE